MTRPSPNTETMSNQDRNVLTVDSKRRSARLLLDVRIAVSGKSRDGLDFQGKTQTTSPSFWHVDFPPDDWSFRNTEIIPFQG